MTKQNSRRTDLILVLILVVVAGLLKLGVVYNTYAISTDSARFIYMAREIRAGQIDRAISREYHLLMPLSMAGLSAATGVDEETAGTIIAVILGALTVVPVYYIGKRLFGRVAGAFGGLLWASHFYIMRETADIMSDGMNIFFVFMALWFCLWALHENRVWLLLLCGVCVGLAYNTRPEGLGAGGAACTFVMLARRFEWSWARKALGVGCVVLAAAAVMAPYVMKISDTPEGCVFCLTPKKSVASLLGLDEAPEPVVEKKEAVATDESPPMCPVDRKPLSVMCLVWGTIEVWAYVNSGVLGLVIIGILYAARKRPRIPAGTALLVGAGLLFLALVMLLSVNIYNTDARPSKRHLMLSAAMLLPVAGAGLAVICGWLVRRFRRKLSPPKALLAALLLCALVPAAMAVPGMRPQREEQTPQRTAADYIHEKAVKLGIENPIVMSTNEKVAYYVGCAADSLVGFPSVKNAAEWDMKAMMRYVRTNDVDFIVVTDEEIAAFTFLAHDKVGDELEFVCYVNAEDEKWKSEFDLDIELKPKHVMTVYRVKK